MRKLMNSLRNLTFSLRHKLEKLQRHLRPSSKTLLIIASVVTITIIAHVVISEWLTTTEILNIPSVFNTPSIGVIRVWGVEAYGGDLTTKNGSSIIDWGTFYPGETKNVSFQVKSVSNMPINLAYNTSWTPKSLTSYMSLKWNYNGTTLTPEQQIHINFSLSLSDSTDAISYLVRNNVTTFSIDINIFTQEPKP